jgi:hypothetical protein
MISWPTRCASSIRRNARTAGVPGGVVGVVRGGGVGVCDAGGDPLWDAGWDGAEDTAVGDVGPVTGPVVADGAVVRVAVPFTWSDVQPDRAIRAMPSAAAGPAMLRIASS